MKNQFRILRTIFAFGIMLVVALLAVNIIELGDLLLAAPAGGIFAMAAGASAIVEGAPATTTTAASASSELLDQVISKKITLMKPDSTPLDTMIRNVGKVIPAKSWKYEYYAADIRGIEDTLSAAFDSSGSGAFDSTGNVNTFSVTNIHIWSVDDGIMFNGVDGSDSNNLVGVVVAKGTTTIDVYLLNDANKIAPDMDLGQAVTRLGNSKSELDAQTDPYFMYPTKSFNYNQIFMAQVEESVYQQMHKKEVNWGISDAQLASIYDMRRGMELSALFGYKALISNPIDSQEQHFTGGVTREISNALTYDPTQTTSLAWNQSWNSWMKNIFNDNTGSDTRYMFVGETLMEKLNNIESFQRQLDNRQEETVYGVKFNKIVSNFGTLYVKLHKLFASTGWSSHAMVLDMNNIEKFQFKPLTTKELDLKTSGVRNTNAYLITEAMGVATRYPDTHAIIAPSS